MVGSHFVKPATERDVWALTTSMSLSTATRKQMKKVHRLRAALEKPKAWDVRSGAYLDLLNVLCGACGYETGWGMAEMELACGRCGVELWDEELYRAASVVRRVTGDFELFNEMLRKGAVARSDRGKIDHRAQDV